MNKIAYLYKMEDLKIGKLGAIFAIGAGCFWLVAGRVLKLSLDWMWEGCIISGLVIVMFYLVLDARIRHFVVFAFYTVLGAWLLLLSLPHIWFEITGEDYSGGVTTNDIPQVVHVGFSLVLLSLVGGHVKISRRDELKYMEYLDKKWEGCRRINCAAPITNSVVDGARAMGSTSDYWIEKKLPRETMMRLYSSAYIELIEDMKDCETPVLGFSPEKSVSCFLTEEMIKTYHEMKKCLKPSTVRKNLMPKIFMKIYNKIRKQEGGN